MNPKFLKKSFLLILLSLLSLSFYAFANDHYTVNTQKLNVRTTIGSSSSPFGYFNYGDTVEVLSKDNPYWYKVIIQGKEGYVRSKYLSLIVNPRFNTSNNKSSNKDILVGFGLILFLIICVMWFIAINKKEKFNVKYNDAPVKTTIIVKYKSVSGAILLTILFGPFGMFYSTIKGALIMLSLPIITTIILIGLVYNNANNVVFEAAILGSILFYALFYWITCVIWSAVAASKTNKIIINHSQSIPEQHEN